MNENYSRNNITSLKNVNGKATTKINFPILISDFPPFLVLVPNSPGGVAFEREVIPPDWVLDYWHPLEKAQYPEYFARREKRKEEYIKWWENQYGKPKPSEGHH